MLVWVVFLLIGGCRAACVLQATHLTTEYRQTDVLFVDKTPRLGWWLTAQSGATNQSQSRQVSQDPQSQKANDAAFKFKSLPSKIFTWWMCGTAARCEKRKVYLTN
jgi:hypothetical protein